MAFAHECRTPFQTYVADVANSHGNASVERCQRNMTTAVTADRGGYNFLERAQQRSPGSVLGQMLTVRQAAQLLGITPATLQRRIKTGTGPAHYKFGNRMLFKRDDVVGYQAAG